jgi:hypothetical protein
MVDERDMADLDDSLRHCRAGLRALEAARGYADRTGGVYPTHLHVASVEMARAIELAMRVALRVH